MPAHLDWVLLAYRMPREPSTPRIAVWRKLRKLGAVQLVDGFVALPADPMTMTLVPSVFAVCCLAACAVPLWRSTKADPVATLRAE